jgi:hypothetical protein
LPVGAKMFSAEFLFISFKKSFINKNVKICRILSDLAESCLFIWQTILPRGYGNTCSLYILPVPAKMRNVSRHLSTLGLPRCFVFLLFRGIIIMRHVLITE